jgi:pectinesterase
MCGAGIAAVGAALLIPVAWGARPTKKPEAVVAVDGTGKYRTIREAIDAAPSLTGETGRRWTILVKPGIYREVVHVPREKRFVALVGEDAEKTVLTFDLFAGLAGPDDKPMGAHRTPTLSVDADDFLIENLTVENTAGPRGPAVARRVDGDRVIVRGCRLLGWQGTVWVNRGRHSFERCHIEGAVDFVWGGATAYFEGCELRCIGSGVITAASTPDFQTQGLVFSRCAVTASRPDVVTFLGRPGKDHAKVTFLNSELAAAVQPAGWDSGKRRQGETTASFAEFASTGPGAAPLARAAWSHVLSAEEAESFSRSKVLDGWEPTVAPKRAY